MKKGMLIKIGDDLFRVAESELYIGHCCAMLGYLEEARASYSRAN